MDDQRLLSRHKPHPARRGIKKPWARSPGPGRKSTPAFIEFGEGAQREFEGSPSPMRIFDHETMKHLAVNDAAVKFYGYTRAEFLALTMKDTRHPDEHAEQLARLKVPAGYLRHGKARRQIKKSGEIVVVEAVIQDILFHGRRARVSLTIDVTEHHRAQALLAQREREYESLAENLPDLIARFDRAHRYVYVNAAIEKHSGKRRCEIIGRTQRELGMPEEVISAYEESLTGVFGVGRPHTLEFRFPGPGGGQMFEAYHVPEKDASGQVATVLCVARDITDRNKAEEEVRRQKQLLETVINNIPARIFIRDAKTLRYVMRNRHSEEDSGHPIGSSIGKSVYDLYPREYADLFSSTDAEALKTGRLVETPELRVTGRSGEPRIRHVRKVPVFDENGQPWVLVGISDDITERKEVERALHESESKYRNLVESSSDLIWSTDAEGRITFINEAVRRIYGYEPEEMLGRPLVELLGGGHTKKSFRFFRTMLSEDRSATDYECEAQHKNGERVVLSSNAIVLRDDAGNRLGVSGISKDITARKRMEAALRQSEERFRQLAENIRQVFWIATPNHDKVVYISPAYEEIWGRNRDSLYRDPLDWMRSVHPDDLPAVQKGIENVARGESLNAEYRIIHPDGTLRWIRDRSYQMKAGDGTPLACGIAEDITDSKRAEQERLTHAMGQRDALVREVHHRIKNSLQGVAGLLRQKIGKYPAIAPCIEEAVAQLQSVALVYGLQETRPDGLLDLAEITNAICSSAETLIGGRVERIFECNSQRPACLAGAEAVSVAVAINELVFNALKHQPAEAGEKRARVTLCETGDAAEIRITNRGRLPAGFDYAGGGAVGSGLGLVRTLLASPGGAVAFNGGPNEVEVILKLTPPLLADRQETIAR